MAKRTNLDDTTYLRWLLYGLPGSTKTRTLASACNDERTAPVLWLNSGGNPESMIDIARPDVITIDKLSDHNAIYDFLVTGQSPIHEVSKLFQLNPPYKSVVVDGITETQRQSFAFVTDSMNVGPGSFPKSIEIQHFNKVLGQMVNFARLYFSLPMHVMMTSQEREDKDDSTGEYRFKPLLWGQSAGEVPGWARLVSRMMHVTRLDNKAKQTYREEIEGAISAALFVPSSKWVAKDQYGGKMPPVMVNPSVTKVLDLIYGPIGEPIPF